MDDLHDSFEKGIIEPVHMRSQDLPADALTKSLSGPILAAHRAKMNLHRIDGVRCDDTKGSVGKIKPSPEKQYDSPHARIQLDV